MKFNLNHDPNNKTLAIPRAALQLSGLAGVSDLILHTDSGCILLLPGDPTVAELLKTISLISAVAPQLISRLAERSQMAMEAGMTETACGACEHEPHCSGLEIPPCQLAEAGISPNAALESFVEDGKVIVQAAEKTAADVLIDDLDDDVRTMLEDSGVQLEGVCRLLEKEEISGLTILIPTRIPLLKPVSGMSFPSGGRATRRTLPAEMLSRTPSARTSMA